MMLAYIVLALCCVILDGIATAEPEYSIAYSAMLGRKDRPSG